MYFLLNMVIFQPAMLVYQRVYIIHYPHSCCPAALFSRSLGAGHNPADCLKVAQAKEKMEPSMVATEIQHYLLVVHMIF